METESYPRKKNSRWRSVRRPTRSTNSAGGGGGGENSSVGCNYSNCDDNTSAAGEAMSEARSEPVAPSGGGRAASRSMSLFKKRPSSVVVAEKGGVERYEFSDSEAVHPRARNIKVGGGTRGRTDDGGDQGSQQPPPSTTGGKQKRSMSLFKRVSSAAAATSGKDDSDCEAINRANSLLGGSGRSDCDDEEEEEEDDVPGRPKRSMSIFKRASRSATANSRSSGAACASDDDDDEDYGDNNSDNNNDDNYNSRNRNGDDDAAARRRDSRMQSLREKKSRLASFRVRRATSSDEGSEFTDKSTKEGMRLSILKRIPMKGIMRSRSTNTGDATGTGGGRRRVRMAPSFHSEQGGMVDHLGGGGSDHHRGYYGGEDGYGGNAGGPSGGGVSFDMSGSRVPMSVDGRSFVEGGGANRSIEGGSFHTPGERARYSIHHGARGAKRKFRVRPYHRFDQPTYMTEEDIYADSLKASAEYEFLRSYIAPSLRLSSGSGGRETPQAVSDVWGAPEDDGRIGAFRVEVLGCIGLGRTKPDVCVYAVCGDSVFATDVLTGYRSPMWPCNSKRAAVFPIHHAYAKLYIGVFDVRVRKNSENDVFCGRVTVDVSSIRPDTEYDITFPLRVSSFVYDRKARGVIRLRFSLHWFNERAAVFSYFKGPKSMARGYPLVKGNPVIPCADPKTFRNLAITVYGLDLPGKYTRNAFRATMREFNLYQQNLRHLVKTLILDTVMYRKPLISLYLFAAGMHCVISSSIRMVPPYWVGYLLILMLSNHRHFVLQQDYNVGYKPLTLWELMMGCLFHYRPECPSFNQIFLQKRTKQRRGRSKMNQRLRRLGSLEGGENNENDPEKEVEIVPLDHREFPYSDRDAYPKFSVEDALKAKSKGSRRGSTTRLHGRLSVYYTTAEPSGEEADGKEDDEGSDDDSDDRDDETVMTETNMGDNVFDMDSDNELEDEDDLETPGRLERRSGQSNVLAVSEEKETQPRVRVGPPQNNDTKTSKKIPPQVHLQRIEKLLHKVTCKIAFEMVHPPEGYGESEKVKEAAETETKKNTFTSSLKKKRPQMDEFDRRLGLQTSSVNPVTRIASSFLGPLMRVIRMFIFSVRVFFNIYTWRDPYMSFWVFIFLLLWCLFLIWFPWRSFFFVVVVASLGPQNLFVRKYLEKKKAAKEKKNLEEELAKLAEKEDGYGYETAVPASAAADKADEKKDNGDPNKPKKPSLFKRLFANKDDLDESMKIERAPFRADGKDTSSSKVQPRCIVIPYTRFKKERFFDWPPDPTVSRATPLPPLVDYFMENLDDFDDFDLDNESTAPAYDEKPIFEFDPDCDFMCPPSSPRKEPPSPPPAKAAAVISDFPGVKPLADFPGVNLSSLDFPGIGVSSRAVANGDMPNGSELRHRKPSQLPAAQKDPDEESYQYQDDWSD